MHRWPLQIGIGPDDRKDPPPRLFSQSWRGCRADVSEGESVFVFWSPEETTHITVSQALMPFWLKYGTLCSFLLIYREAHEYVSEENEPFPDVYQI